MKPMVSENFSTCSATSRSRRTSRALSSVVRPRSVRRRTAVWVARRTFSVVCSICAPESRVSAPAAATSPACWVSCSESRASALTGLAAWAAPPRGRRAEAATSWLDARLSAVVRVGAERAGYDRPPQPYGLAAQPGIGVEAELTPPAITPRRVRDELHFVRPGVVPREPHVLPGDQPAGELLNPREALRQADVPRDR